MLLKLPVRREFGGGRAQLGAMGIGETEQFLLQTLIGGVASFSGGFLGGRAGAGSGGATPALQTLTAAAAPPLQLPAGPTGPSGQPGAAGDSGKLRLSTTGKVILGGGALVTIGTIAWLVLRDKKKK